MAEMLPLVRELGSLGILAIFMLFVLPRHLDKMHSELASIRRSLQRLAGLDADDT